MNSRNRGKKNDPKSTIISLIVLALFLLPEELTAVLVLLAVMIVPVILAARKKKGTGGRKAGEQPFDDCPKPICFHKDKGEHHVARGKEIDPWDRPDIDISKYQRR